MNTGIDNANELNPTANDQPVETEKPPSKKFETISWVIAIIVAALVGFIGTLLAIWVPAQYYDSRVNAEHPGAGAGATLGAFFLGTPLACIIGPIVGTLAGLSAKRFSRKSPLAVGLPAAIGAGFVAGLLSGLAVILPFLWFNR